MARRAAGPAGPLHSTQEPAPGEVGAVDPESLERLRRNLLHGRAAHAARTAPLRVEDPVHPPPGSDAGWADAGWAETGWAETGWADDRWPDEAADPDALAGGESTVMHPDDLAALHALPTTTAETRAWTGDGAQAGGRRLVGSAQDLSVWEDDPSWDGGHSWEDGPSRGGEPAGSLLRQRWLQLTLCAVLALVVGASLALLATGRQVDAARAEADRQRQAASSAQADLVRERAARASERAGDTAPPPVRAAPPGDPAQDPAASAAPPAAPPAPPVLPTGPQRPPVAESPAPTVDPGPPPPGPSPTTPQQGRSGTAAPPDRPVPSPSASSDNAAKNQAVSPTDLPTCPSAPSGAEGDGPATCP